MSQHINDYTSLNAVSNLQMSMNVGNSQAVWDPETETFIEQFDGKEDSKDEMNFDDVLLNVNSNSSKKIKDHPQSDNPASRISVRAREDATMADDIEQNFVVDKAHLLSFTDNPD